jgi:hypothetical protein
MKTLTTELVDTEQKRDARGRRIERSEQRAALIAAYEQSGLSLSLEVYLRDLADGHHS